MNGTRVISYTYDELNQLIRENNAVLNKTITYTYDLGGNMTSRKEYVYTRTARTARLIDSGNSIVVHYTCGSSSSNWLGWWKRSFNTVKR